MIVSKVKDLQGLLERLSSYSRLFLLGCGECATICNSGSEEALLHYKEFFEKRGKVVVGWDVPEIGCNEGSLKKSLALNRKFIKESEAIVVFSCGLGVGLLRRIEFLNKPLISGTDTLFAGITTSQGFFENCRLCGNCYLNETLGFCPQALCPKGMLNGPCGGVKERMCEVYPNRECVWILIFESAQKNARIEILKEINPPRDHSLTTPPQELKI